MVLARISRHGSKVEFWKAMPTIFRGPFTLLPATMMVPELGGTNPVTSFIKDDLPQPEGPTTAANSPLATDIRKSESAWVSALSPYLRPTLSIATNGTAAAETAAVAFSMVGRRLCKHAFLQRRHEIAVVDFSNGRGFGKTEPFLYEANPLRKARHIEGAEAVFFHIGCENVLVVDPTQPRQFDLRIEQFFSLGDGVDRRGTVRRSIDPSLCGGGRHTPDQA